MRQVTTITGDQLCLFDLGVNMGKLCCERAEILAARRLCARSQVNYRSDFGIFERWCLAAGRCALPAVPDTLSLFVTAQLAEGHKVSTVDRRLAGIRHARCLWGYVAGAAGLPGAAGGCAAQAEGAAGGQAGSCCVGSGQDLQAAGPLCCRGARSGALGFWPGVRVAPVEIVALDLADVQVTVRAVGSDWLFEG